MIGVARHVLAIDVGTYTVKVALISIDGEIVASEQEALEVTQLPGGGAEQDPERWWSLVTRAMRQEPVPPESVIAVACTAQWTGTVAVDEQCQPLRRAMIWMDSRGAPGRDRHLWPAASRARMVRSPLRDADSCGSGSPVLCPGALCETCARHWPSPAHPGPLALAR